MASPNLAKWWHGESMANTKAARKANEAYKAQSAAKISEHRRNGISEAAAQYEMRIKKARSAA